MIDLTGVSKVYPVKNGGQVVALDGVNLHVERGSIHGIVGRSGAGKSTLIRCLTALEKPTDGHIVVDGRDLSTLTGADLRAARRRIGMVFQAANLLDARTAAENIGYPLKLAGVPSGTSASMSCWSSLACPGAEAPTPPSSPAASASASASPAPWPTNPPSSYATSRRAHSTPNQPRRSSRCCAACAMSPVSRSSSSPTRWPSFARSAIR